MGASAYYASCAGAYLTSRPPGTLEGGGSSLARWNRLTTTLGDTLDHLRDMLFTT